MWCVATARWYCYDDSHVHSVDAGDVQSSAAYMLFYRRRAEGQQDGDTEELLRTLLEQGRLLDQGRLVGGRELRGFGEGFFAVGGYGVLGGRGFCSRGLRGLGGRGRGQGGARYLFIS